MTSRFPSEAEVDEYLRKWANSRPNQVEPKITPKPPEIDYDTHDPKDELCRGIASPSRVDDDYYEEDIDRWRHTQF